MKYRDEHLYQKIACSMKNSFAISNRGDLFSWGSSATGMLGYSSDNNINYPHQIKCNEKLTVESISSGHSHVGIITKKRNGNILLNKDMSYAKDIFLEFQKIFKESFINELIMEKNNSQIISFIYFMLKLFNKPSLSVEIRMDDFEQNFLDSFYEFQKNDNFQMIHMFSKLFEDKFHVKRDRFDISQLEKIITDNDLIEVKNYILQCISHFQTYSDDIAFFINIIAHFEQFLTKKQLFHLFSYCIPEQNENHKHVVNQIFRDLRQSINGDYYIQIDDIIDAILGEDVHNGLVYMWGVRNDGRIGISSFSHNNIQTDQVNFQICPIFVRFPSIFIRIAKISCGFSHTLALTTKGTVFSFGRGIEGCLGTGSLDEISISVPQQIEIDTEGNKFIEIQDIAAGMHFSSAIDVNGRLFSWGSGKNGRLGHENLSSYAFPKIVSFFSYNAIAVTKLSSGESHLAVITEDQYLYTFGNGKFGKLGIGSMTDAPFPQKVEKLANYNSHKVFCGCNTTACIVTERDNKKTQRKLFVWGKNCHGMLGIEYMKDQNILYPIELALYQSSLNSYITEVSLGTMHMMILFSDGSIFTCGNAIEGILGISDVYDKIDLPRKIEGTEFYAFEDIYETILKSSKLFYHYSTVFAYKEGKVAYASCSNGSCAYINNQGDLYMSKGCELLPKSQNIPNEENIKIEFFRNKVDYISLGKSHVIAISNGRAYSWGDSKFGKLGINLDLHNKSNGEILFVSSPTLIETIPSAKMSCVSSHHSLVLTLSKQVYVFGLNTNGQLGLGTSEDLKCLYLPTLSPLLSHVEYISCSNTHSACISFDSESRCTSVYTWGSAFAGKLGFNTNQTEANEPTLVTSLERNIIVVKIECGEEFTICLDYEGRLFGWGRKKFLGIASQNGNNILSRPIQLLKDIRFVFINAKENTAVGIDMDYYLHILGQNAIQNDSEKCHFTGVCDDLIVSFNNNQDQNVSKVSSNEEQKNEIIMNNYMQSEIADMQELNVNSKSQEKEIFPLQLRLIKEKLDQKSCALLAKDKDISFQFGENIKNFLFFSSHLQQMHHEIQLDIENKIICQINDIQIKQHTSPVMNSMLSKISLYEEFISSLYNHPCFMTSLLPFFQARDFLALVRILYGTEKQKLHNDKLLNVSLLAFWNSVCISEVDHIEDVNEVSIVGSVVYQLYKKILFQFEENLNLLIHIIADILIMIIRETFEGMQYDIEACFQEKDQFLILYQVISPDIKSRISDLIEAKLIQLYENLLNDLKDKTTTKYNYTLGCMLLHLYKTMKKNKAKNFSLIKFFLICPLKSILMAVYKKKRKSSFYIEKIVKAIMDILIENQKSKEYSQLFNLAQKKNVKGGLLPCILSEMSEVLRHIIENVDNVMSDKDILSDIQKSVCMLKYDFSLITFHEIIKFGVNAGRTQRWETVLPFALGEIFKLAESFQVSAKDNATLTNNPILANLVTQLNLLPVSSDDHTSIVNLKIRNSYYHPSKKIELDAIITQCKMCKLIFFNDDHKPPFQLKRYSPPKEDDLANIFETLLVNLPLFTSTMDIQKLFNQMKQTKETVDTLKTRELLSQFLVRCEERVWAMFEQEIIKESEKENNPQYIICRNLMFNDLIKQCEKNFTKREHHYHYLTIVNSVIQYINDCLIQAKSDYASLKSLSKKFKLNVKQGIINSQFRKHSPLFFKSNDDKNEIPLKQLKTLSSYLVTSHSIMTKYSILKLKRNKVIIDFNKKYFPLPLSKYFLQFDRVPRGYAVKILIKSGAQCSLACTPLQIEYQSDELLIDNVTILDLRRLMMYHTVYIVGYIQFNVFYLIKLLNSFERI